MLYIELVAVQILYCSSSLPLQCHCLFLSSYPFFSLELSPRLLNQGSYLALWKWISSSIALSPTTLIHTFRCPRHISLSSPVVYVKISFNSFCLWENTTILNFQVQLTPQLATVLHLVKWPTMIKYWRVFSGTISKTTRIESLWFSILCKDYPFLNGR